MAELYVNTRRRTLHKKSPVRFLNRISTQNQNGSDSDQPNNQLSGSWNAWLARIGPYSSAGRCRSQF